MAKIKCSQCGAVNQDVMPADPCWQCGASLGAGETSAAPPPATHAESAVERTERPKAGGPARLDRYYEKPAAPNRAPLFIGVAIVLILLLIFILSRMMHR